MRGAVAAVAAALVILAGAAFLVGGDPGPGGTSSPRPSPTRRPAPTPLPPVTPATPSATPVVRGIVAEAVVVPRRSAQLSMPITGRVIEVPVEEDEYVFTGEILVRLDRSTREAAVRVAEADVARAEAEVDNVETELRQLPSDAPLAQRAALEADLRLAEAELQFAESALAEAELELAQTELRAPFAGTVASIDVAVGEQAVADQPIVTIGDLSGWFIQTIDLSELDVVRVAVGDRAEMTFQALPDVTLEGTVDRIQVRGTAQPGAVRFDVFIRPDVHRDDLRWNMSATVRILPDA